VNSLQIYFIDIFCSKIFIQKIPYKPVRSLCCISVQGQNSLKTQIKDISLSLERGWLTRIHWQRRTVLMATAASFPLWMTIYSPCRSHLSTVKYVVNTVFHTLLYVL